MNVEIEHVSKIFGRDVRALSDVTLTIPNGMYGLLGPNGAGKTTLMRILAGILRPSSGAVSIGRHDLATQGGRLAVKRTLGYLPQELGLYPDLSAYEFLDYLAILKGMNDTQKRRARVNELLKTVGLDDVTHRKLKGFSGGMKRRVGIAQALLNDPQWLIVDEPTAGLDPEERIRFRNLLVSLAANRTALLSTHIVQDLAQTSTRLAVLHRGAVIFQGASAQLLAAARGRVWTFDTADPAPDGRATIVSALNVGAGTRYRAIADTPPTADATSAEPNLEDGYVALMQSRGSAIGLNEAPA
jgi:ABC-2 type transport system ATP-binding protein